MTEKEYIRVRNLDKIETMEHLAGELMAGDAWGVSTEDKDALNQLLYKMSGKTRKVLGQLGLKGE